MRSAVVLDWDRKIYWLKQKFLLVIICEFWIMSTASKKYSKYSGKLCLMTNHTVLNCFQSSLRTISLTTNIKSINTVVVFVFATRRKIKIAKQEFWAKKIINLKTHLFMNVANMNRSTFGDLPYTFSRSFICLCRCLSHSVCFSSNSSAHGNHLKIDKARVSNFSLWK